jgi:uncharacterized peroxidase-related enzyme
VVKQVQTDFRKADLDSQTRALLEFAEKVSLTPYKIVDEDLNQLREAGLKDADIFLATHIIGIFNYLVRLADVFDLELEPEVTSSSKE